MTFETIVDGIRNAANEDDIAAWWKESQYVVISASQRMALEQAADQRKHTLSAAARQ